MTGCIKKSDLYEYFEYGDGNFPIWFNVLVGSRVELISERIFTPIFQEAMKISKNSPRPIAGKFDGKDFFFGDIILKRNDGYIEIISKEDFIKNYILIPEDFINDFI